MKSFESYFSEEAIIEYLCKLRAKVAKSRNSKHMVHLMTYSTKYNYHLNDVKNYTEYERSFYNDLLMLFPSRRKWVKLRKDMRYNKKTNQLITSDDKNYFSLIKTIKRDKEKDPDAHFLKHLKQFTDDIKNTIKSTDYLIKAPFVYPKLKNKKIDRKNKNECRPISQFSLKDRVILSLTNKFLTTLFDSYFEDCSYAFRTKQKKKGNIILSHHDCVKDINDFRKNNIDPLWVVECDMEKFYDSVNHKTIRYVFNNLIEKAKNDHPELDLKGCIYFFNKFLACYSFNKNVLPLNQNEQYWKNLKLMGEYKWVASKFKELEYYDDLESEEIGIPQGGALSGLIANMVLDIADKEVKRSGVFYVRFCDDMIILDSNLEKCEIAKQYYLESLKKMRLVTHDFSENLSEKRESLRKRLPPNTLKPFWESKSKGPFKWSSLENGGYPWIGFVGYELHHEGHLRVRKKAFHKELDKQKNIIKKISRAIKYQRRKSLKSVSESVIHRLVGMSVGRVSLRNFSKLDNKMCWKSGFRLLRKNKHSLRQIKELDRNRNRLFYRFINDLRNGKISKDANTLEIPAKKRQIIDFNRPFSYYYQTLVRNDTSVE